MVNMFMSVHDSSEYLVRWRTAVRLSIVGIWDLARRDEPRFHVSGRVKGNFQGLLACRGRRKRG
jgi:hypothetical protein